MKMRAGRIISGVAASLLFGGCAPQTTPEQQVRELIAQAEAHAEARDLAGLMALVSADYSDRQGRDKSELTHLMRGFFVLNQSVNLLVRIDEIELPADDLARAQVTVGLLGRRGTAEDWQFAAEVHELEVELLNEDGEWRVLHAERRRRL